MSVAGWKPQKSPHHGTSRTPVLQKQCQAALWTRWQGISAPGSVKKLCLEKYPIATSGLHVHRREHTGKVGCGVGKRWGVRERGREILRLILKLHPRLMKPECWAQVQITGFNNNPLKMYHYTHRSMHASALI